MMSPALRLPIVRRQFSPPPLSPDQIAESSEDMSRVIMVIQTTFCAIATVALLLRIYARRKLGTKLGADDWWMVGAWVFGIPYLAAGTILVKSGIGRHIWTLSLTDFQTYLFAIWLIQLLYPFMVGCIKMSILCLYLRMFPSGRTRMAVFVIMPIIVAQTIAISLTDVFSCHPVNGSWDLTVQSTCIQYQVFQEISGVLNAVMDVVILLLPLPVLTGLHVDWRKKLGIILTFAIGGLACTCSIIRAVMLFILFQPAQHQDPSWSGVGVSIISSIETSLGVICASLPVLRSLITGSLRDAWRRISPSFRSAPKNQGDGIKHSLSKSCDTRMTRYEEQIDQYLENETK